MAKEKHFYLLRGLIREARHWGGFSQKLELAFPGCKITYIEIPGTGKYHQSPSPLTISQMVEQSRLDLTIDPKEENILVAISLGGMVATRWAELYPDDFNFAFLINTSFGNFSPFYRRMNPRSFLKLVSNPSEKMILDLVKNNHTDLESIYKDWKEIKRTSPVSLKNTLKQLIAAATFKAPDLSPFKKVYLINSAEDRLVDPFCSEDIAHRWGCSLSTHPKAGHDLPSDDGEWLVNQISAAL